MNYLLVIFTLLVLAFTMVGIAALGSDRLIPGRKVIGYVAQDGIDIAKDYDFPLLVSEKAEAEELKKIRFTTSAAGYNKDEVDQLMSQLIRENEALRAARQAGAD